MQDLERLVKRLDLVEPSARTDDSVLGFARSLSRRQRGPKRRRTGLHVLVLAGAVAALVPVIFLFWPANLLGPSLWGPAYEGQGNVAVASQDLAEIREDLDQIREMAELIPPDRQDEQVTIKARVIECLKDLEDLEARLQILLDDTAPSEEKPLEANSLDRLESLEKGVNP